MKLYGKYFIQIIFLTTIINTVNNRGGEQILNNSTNFINDTQIISTEFQVPTSSATIPTTIPSTTSSTIPTTTSTTIPANFNQESEKITDLETSSNSEIIEPPDILPTSQEEKVNNNYNDYDKCWDTEPTKGIIDDCILGTKLENETCCYMTIKYKYNNFYACIPVKKDKKVINERIKVLKDIYVGNKSIKINCFSSFVKINLVFLLLICYEFNFFLC